jgi:uncharacterized protein involved in exopolysaccharide biosynthesis
VGVQSAHRLAETGDQIDQSATGRPDAHGQGAGEPWPDRFGLLWHARWRILAVVIAAVALTVGGSFLVPEVYESSAQVMIKVPSVSQDGVLASSGLAAQYAEVVRAGSVVEPAAQALAVPSAALAAHTSAGTVGGQNLIQVTVQWGSRETARRAADALAASLVAYIDRQTIALTRSYQEVVDAQLAPLDDRIAIAQERVLQARHTLSKSDNGASLSDLTAAQSLLTSLVDRRTTLAVQSALQRASLGTQVQVIAQADQASQVQPKPVVYGAVAAVVALFVSGQVVLAVARRRLLSNRLKRQ